jgi:hypothetical protein
MPYEVEQLPRHAINHIQQPPECPLLAFSGHHSRTHQCPLLGVKRTLQIRPVMSAFDPKRKSSLQFFWNGQELQH